MLNLIGWIGGICFAISGIPQAYWSWKEGHSKGLSWSFLLLWLGGEVFTLVYVSARQDWPLIFNYVFNLMSLLVIIYYKLRPRAEKCLNS